MSEKLAINETKSLFHHIENKHHVYYVEGIVVKTFAELQKGVDERKLVENLDKKTGQRRYLDFNEGKWLKQTL